ncbi:MAG: hypothetical protein ABIF71_11025 [Planctomycetota bacterium]
MLFKPKWYKLLDENYRPSEKEQINELEQMRKRLNLAHEVMAMLARHTAWAIIEEFNNRGEIIAPASFKWFNVDDPERAEWQLLIQGFFTGKFNLLKIMSEAPIEIRSTLRVIPTEDLINVTVARLFPGSDDEIVNIINGSGSYREFKKHIFALEDDNRDLFDPFGVNWALIKACKRKIVKIKTETNKYKDPDCGLYRHSKLDHYVDDNDYLYECTMGFHSIPVPLSASFEEALCKSISFSENPEEQDYQPVEFMDLVNAKKHTKGSTSKLVFRDGSFMTTYNSCRE